jgi:microcin C transport system permease protein
MIENRLHSDLAKKRWRRFRSDKLAVGAVWLLLILAFFSFTAELWANRKPVVMSYQGSLYFPVFKHYDPRIFGREDVAEMDYRSLFTDSASVAGGPRADWAVWPIIRWDPFERNEKVESLPAPPSSDNWLGTDEGGRDVASRLLYGFRYSMSYALAVWLFASILGAVAGAAMGYWGGWMDLLGQRVIDVLESVPYLMIILTLVSIFKPGLIALALITVFFTWVRVAVYFRAEFLKMRRLEFIEGARAAGASHVRILFQHLLPNGLTPWLTYTPFLIAVSITNLAALDFLGYGLSAPTPSWGELLNQALKNFRNSWWLAFYPSFALFLTLMLLNLVGGAVRDALDPRV